MFGRMNLLQRHFDRSKNPVFAWQAIALCFELKLEFPDWILAYLQSSSAAVLRADKKTSEREAERVGRALGFGRSEGETGSFDAAYESVSNEMMYQEVLALLSTGEKPWRAHEIVGKKHGFSPSTVRRAYLQFLSPAETKGDS